MFEHTMEDRLVNFMYGVYGLMSGGLALTATTAYMISKIPHIQYTLLGNPILMTLIVIGQFALVIGLSAAIQRLTFPMALTMFFVYALSMGVTLSTVFMVYTEASIVQTFAVAAGMFGISSIYGYLTGADLTKIGNIMMMLVWGIILALFVNFFMRSPMLDLVVSAIGVVVFTVLTAYDTQKLKQMGEYMLDDNEMVPKVAVIGALTLYLDFINLFLFLLRFLGRQRD